jgi:hypothetical protein
MTIKQLKMCQQTPDNRLPFYLPIFEGSLICGKVNVCLLFDAVWRKQLTQGFQGGGRRAIYTTKTL